MALYSGPLFLTPFGTLFGNAFDAAAAGYALLGVMPALGLPRHGLLLSRCYFTFTGLLVHESARKKQRARKRGLAGSEEEIGSSY